MNKDNVDQFEGREAVVQDFMLQFLERLLDDGRAAVVRNGHQPERELQTGIGGVFLSRGQ